MTYRRGILDGKRVLVSPQLGLSCRQPAKRIAELGNEMTSLITFHSSSSRCEVVSNICFPEQHVVKVSPDDVAISMA